MSALVGDLGQTNNKITRMITKRNRSISKRLLLVVVTFVVVEALVFSRAVVNLLCTFNHVHDCCPRPVKRKLMRDVVVTVENVKRIPFHDFHQHIDISQLIDEDGLTIEKCRPVPNFTLVNGDGQLTPCSTKVEGVVGNLDLVGTVIEVPEGERNADVWVGIGGSTGHSTIIKLNKVYLPMTMLCKLPHFDSVGRGRNHCSGNACDKGFHNRIFLLQSV